MLYLLILILINYKAYPPSLLSSSQFNNYSAFSNSFTMDKFHAGRSNFSQTCNLLSQYLKENGGFGDLNFTPNFPQSSIGKLNSVSNSARFDFFFSLSHHLLFGGNRICQSGSESKSGKGDRANDDILRG